MLVQLNICITFDSSTGKVIIALSGWLITQWYGKAVVLSTTGASIPSVGSATVFESGL